MESLSSTVSLKMSSVNPVYQPSKFSNEQGYLKMKGSKDFLEKQTQL